MKKLSFLVFLLWSGFCFAQLDSQGPFIHSHNDYAQKKRLLGALQTRAKSIEIDVFLLDNERKVQYVGAIDDNARSAESVKVKYLENAIDVLGKGEKPSPNLTKAIGCPVKAKRRA